MYDLRWLTWCMNNTILAEVASHQRCHTCFSKCKKEDYLSVEAHGYPHAPMHEYWLSLLCPVMERFIQKLA